MILSGVPGLARTGTIISGGIVTELEPELGLRTKSKITSSLFLHHAHTDAPHSRAGLEIVRTEMFPPQRPGWSRQAGSEQVKLVAQCSSALLDIIKLQSLTQPRRS